jgi:transcriptional regulator with AAA-type ATPase domain/tetratricopeptide (TPR) repeat protein
MDPLAELVGESPAMEAVRDQVRRLLTPRETGRRLPSILLNGETGTGKGLVARTIHRAGARAGGPFVDVNCAAIPETLLEAELFGFERGAFTDARRSKPGLFQAAHRGTIFLDEVGLLPEPLQAKLLKVLEEQAVRRLGATTAEPVDTWIISATNADLLAAVRQRAFREDLYHRLAVLTLRLPPLRERGSDVLVLARRFLGRVCADYGLPSKQFAPDAEARLQAYPWPGNIRELSNVVERVALLAEGDLVTADMLELRSAPMAGPVPAVPAAAAVSLDDAMREHLRTTLTQTAWNISRTAALLGISRNTLRARIDKLGLRAESQAETAPIRSRRGERAAPAAPVPAAPRPVSAPAPIRWEQRPVAFLRASLVTAESIAADDEAPSLETNRALDTLIQKTEAFGGRLIEIVASGITAAFGLEPVEDAPRRAAHAAMAMHKAALRDADGQVARVTLKTAIHVERVPFTHIGAVADIDGDAKRRVWSVLDALIAAAGPEAIVVSQPTMSLLARRFAVVQTGAASDASGGAYRLTEYRQTPFDLGGRIGRFVGRDNELDLLASRLEAARQGQGQLVSLIGEAGIGKSRLLFEFRQSLAGQPVTYLEGHCFSYGSAIPYLPILELLRAICGLVEYDTPEVVTGKVHLALDRVGIDPSRGAPFLLHLLGIKGAAESLTTLSPETIKVRTFETLHALFLSDNRPEPLVLAVEDLQWIDPASEAYLGSLADRVVGGRILLAATYRPGYRSPWINKSSATQIAIQPLAPQESLSVVRVAFGSDEIADPLARLILAKAEGNPFFLEELARAAREQGVESTSLTAPDTVQEVLLARIDRLPPAVTSLLQAAAAIGKDFSFEILRALAGSPDDVIRDGLRHLQGAEFIHQTGSVPEAEYTFRHALTHEVAYEHLTGERRRELHGRILAAIETLYPARLAEHIERLAHHAFHGAVWGKAVTYLRQAGNNAAARSANREAVARFEQALVALAHLPSSREATEQAIDLRFELRNPLHLLAEFGRLFDHLREAQALSEAIDDQWRLGWVVSYLTQTLRLTGAADRAIQSGQRAVAIAEARGDFRLQVATEFHLGSAYEDLGDYRRASEILRRVVERLQGDRVYERFGLSGLPSVVARAHLMCCLAELGEFTEGSERGAEGIRIAEEVHDPHGLVNAEFGAATIRILKGEFHEAIPGLERGLGLCQSSNLLLMFPRVAAALGFVYAQSGRLPEAVPLLERAVEQAASLRLTNMQSTFLTWLGETCLMAGRMEDAVRLTERALDRAREQKEQGHEAHAFRLLGELAARRTPPDFAKSESCYRRAFALAEELGMRPLLARCHLALGRLYRQAGQRASGDQHLALATALFREMDMRVWLEEGQKDLRGLG